MGLGTSGLGTSPFGYGTPLTADPPADGPAGVPFIDPVARDYQKDEETGQLKQMPSLRQRVLLKVLTLRGSSSARPRFGIKFPETMGDGFERQIESAVRFAFHHETDVEKIMRIEQVISRRVSSIRAEVTIVYTDLESGEEDRVAF